jgi:hypothetical protein
MTFIKNFAIFFTDCTLCLEPCTSNFVPLCLQSSVFGLIPRHMMLNQAEEILDLVNQAVIVL